MPEDLFQHQKEDLDHLLSTDSNFINTSEMGTGKTPIAIGLSQFGNYRKTLIVCPKTLRLEWSRQIAEWTEIDAAVSKRGCYRRLEPLFYDMMGKSDFNPFFIVNYDTFRTRRHLDVLNACAFDLIILDEVHRLRNPRTRQTKGVFEFLEAHEDSRVLLMTGSPIVNNPADLHTLLRMVKPEEFSSNRNDFIDNFCYTSEKTIYLCRACRRRSWRYSPVCPYCGSSRMKEIVKRKPTGLKNLAELRRITDPFTIRRTKKEVLPWLPDKYPRRVLLEMDNVQRKLYKQMEDELFILLDSGEPLWAPGVLALLMRLRQLNLEPKILGVDAPSVKTDFLLGLIEDLGDEKLVIYSTFEKYIMYLHYLPDMPKHIIITGDTPVDDRVPLSMKFNDDDSIKLCLATIGPQSPGGEGLTLTGASNAVFPDRWWTPTTNTQAEDRLHRIGQKNAVQIITPVTENSIDGSLDTILERKKKFSEEYLDDSDAMKEVIEDLRASREGRPPEEDMDEDEEDEGENGD